MRYVWKAGGVVLVSLVIAAAAWIPAFGINTVLPGSTTGHTDSGTASVQFTVMGLLPGTTAYVAIVGWHVVFDNNQQYPIDNLIVRQQKAKWGGWEWSNGEHSVDANGQVTGWFYVEFSGVHLIGCCHSAITIDYLVVGEGQKPCLGYNGCGNYLNSIGTGETAGTSSGGGGAASVTGGGFVPNSRVFIALIGWELEFTENSEHEIHEIGMRTMIPVPGTWDFSNGFPVGADGSFGARYWTFFDDASDDDPYRFLIQYAVLGMVDPGVARFKPDAWPRAVPTSGGTANARGAGTAELEASGFYPGPPEVFPLLSGWSLDGHIQRALGVQNTPLHEVKLRLQWPAPGNWEFARSLPADAAGRVRGRYWSAFNDSSDDDNYDFSVASLLLGYGP